MMPAGGSGGPQAALAGALAPLAQYVTFDQVVALIGARRDILLQNEVKTNLRLVRYSPGRIEFEPTENAATDLASRLAGRLQQWTGARWGVSIAQGGGPTIAEVATAENDAQTVQALQDPLVQAIFAAFPKARIARFVPPVETVLEVAQSALAEVEDEWDPFED